MSNANNQSRPLLSTPSAVLNDPNIVTETPQKETEMGLNSNPTNRPVTPEYTTSEYTTSEYTTPIRSAPTMRSLHDGPLSAPIFDPTSPAAAAGSTTAAAQPAAAADVSALTVAAAHGHTLESAWDHQTAWDHHTGKARELAQSQITTLDTEHERIVDDLDEHAIMAKVREEWDIFAQEGDRKVREQWEAFYAQASDRLVTDTEGVRDEGGGGTDHIVDDLDEHAIMAKVREEWDIFAQEGDRKVREQWEAFYAQASDRLFTDTEGVRDEGEGGTDHIVDDLDEHAIMAKVREEWDIFAQEGDRKVREQCEAFFAQASDRLVTETEACAMEKKEVQEAE